MVFDIELRNREKRHLWHERVYRRDEPSRGSRVFQMRWGEEVTIGFLQRTFGGLRGSLELWQVGP